MIIKLMQIPFFKKLYIGLTYLLSVIPDSQYLKLVYWIRMKKGLNLNNPKTFNEKINWLKIADTNINHSKMVDKYEVREYIATNLGEEYLIPLLGVYDNANDIDLGNLPDEFVIKCTHDSGSVFLCHNKEELTVKKRQEINDALHRKYYYSCRENLYKYVKPRIVIEKLMRNEDNSGLVDYKFYCFNGVPKYVYVSSGLDNHSTARISFFNIDFSDADFQRGDYKQFETKPSIPKNYTEMVAIARVLSKNIPFVRVDLYEINGRIFFSELTFSPCGGMMPFVPKEYDRILGDELDLSGFASNG